MGRLIRGRGPLIAAVLAVVAFLIGSMLRALVGEETAEQVAEDQAAPLAVLCTVDPAEAVRVGADCEQAFRVARDGVDGEAGAIGAPGRGILGTRLEGDRLIVAYDDGRTEDVGRVAGEDGVGITATTIEDGRLMVVYDDGRRVDLGTVVGPRGVGIADLDGTTGRLLVTLTDGTVVDAGPLPPGPQGDTGATGPGGADAPAQRGAVFRLSDGRTFVCDRSGGPDDYPEYECPTPPGPEPDPSPTPTPEPLLPGG